MRLPSPPLVGLLGLALLLTPWTALGCGGPSPWRVYLSWVGDPRTSVAVSAQVGGPVPSFGVRYGTSPWALDGWREASGTGLGGEEEAFRYTALLDGLAPGTTYYYELGAEAYGWSPTYRFTTAPAGAEPFTFLAVADLGTSPNASATVRQMANRSFAFVLHVGDLSYAGLNGTNWSAWFDLITPLASGHPYMVVPGNHENGSVEEKQMFRERFAMPWAGPLDLGHTGPYYSFNYSNVHFVALAVDTPDHGYPADPRWDAIQTAWLAHDLAAAANDSAHPWIVAYLHFPLFTSTLDPNATWGDSGSWLVGRQVWGALFDRYGVDLVITAHKHNYERTYPVWSNGTVADASKGPYVDPQAPLYVVTGGGGEKLQPRGPIAFPWSAVKAKTHEFVEVSVAGNRLDLRAVSSHGGSLLDAFTLLKEEPRGPAAPPPPGSGPPPPVPAPPPGPPGGPPAPQPLRAPPAPPWSNIVAAAAAGVALMAATIAGLRGRRRV